jgi:HK97 family phage major capsid protein
MLVALTDESAALQRFRRVPVSAAQVRFPILSALPMAYWVSGDTGVKQTTEMAWGNKYLNIEEIACVCPIPENVLDDVLDAGNIDVWGELQPADTAEIARTLDAAVFFGINAPGTFPTNVAAAAAAAGNTHTEGAAVAAGGIQDDIDVVQGLVETDGYDADGIVSARTLRGKLRRLRNTLGDRASGTDPAITEYNGLPISYPMRGQWPTATGSPEAFVGEFNSQFVIGVRRDITMKLLDQAVITDNTGAIVYNLPQQDMVAMRFTFRAGWQVANPINWDQPVEASRYPVGVLVLP